MNTNMFVFYCLVSLVAISLIAIEFFSIKFIVSFLKLDVKYDKPKEVIALIIIEIIAVLTSVNTIQKFPFIFAIMCLFLFIKTIGLWNLKKWILYFYLISNAISWYVSATSTKGKDITTLLATGVIGSVLILTFYYVRVFLPNKTKFV